jgi:hypothetical protein
MKGSGKTSNPTLNSHNTGPATGGHINWTYKPGSRHHASLTGRDLRELSFYLAFSAMKLAVLLEGVHARYLAGQTVTDGYQGAGDAVPFLVAKGLRHLSSPEFR